MRGRHEATLRLLYDVRALGMLPTISSGPVPWSSASLRPAAVHMALNDLLLGAKRSAVEFGAGVSTLYLGHVLAQQGGHLWSFEHDLRWFDAMRRFIERESLADHVTLVHAPLEGSEGSTPWYSRSVVDQALGSTTIEHLLVDGPPAGGNGPPEARYPALPFLLDRLSKDATVILDDVTRPGEEAVRRRWEAVSDFRFRIRRVSCDAAIGRRASDWSL